MARFTSGLRGSITALATPFSGERIDEAALGRLAWRQVQRGTAALVVCGSTGEAATLTPAEQLRAVAVGAEVAGSRVPVLAGCTDSRTDAAASLAADAVRGSADGLPVP